MTFTEKYLILTGVQRRLLSEAVFFLYVAKLLLLFLPVKKVLKIKYSLRSNKRQNDTDFLKEIRLSLLRADRLSTWRNKCLVKSLAGRWMLQRRNIPCAISFGVMYGKGEKLVAHAWLTAGSFEVVEKGGAFLELASY